MLSVNKFLIPAAVAASVLLSACGGSSHKASNNASAPSAPASSQPSSALVKTASVPSVGGTVLVDAKGMTLYRLSGERASKFICTSSGCLQVWHPLTVPSGGKPSGSVGSLGVVKRPDGTMQVTYKGMPLYTFAQDSAPGQAKGQGIKDVGTWNAVTTSAAKASSSSSSSSSQSSAAASPPASSGGGYNY